ncbi:carboxypeptidase-like regulatory domain-containing protein [Corallococcus sp. bb12-1]|uniref:carboxypeptidase-like regulatory domain-containing protein n=1 Tax=Corallococcus sp. bb12-1 TaxID=2996784 RepID=UPI00226F5395|nr:carboxypeptidase-like regulatory domain-containing protein [Corallococcus sp. bb12-1]MCY1042016.1 carboxypeptidase-like regulatory domain-containing protein [Corallococcus sp. bb12-1]
MNTNRRGALTALVVAMALAVLPACDPDAEQDPDTTPETRKGRITGNVSMSDGASPAGAEIHLQETDTRITTTAQGTFAFEALDVGTYTFVISKAGYQSLRRSVDLEAGKTVSMGIEMDPGAATNRLSGTITLEGASSHEGITVSLENTAFTTTTNAQGGFVLEGLEIGSYTLLATKEGYASEETYVGMLGSPRTVNLTLGRP